MQRIRALELTAAPAESRPLLEAVQRKLGVTPNLFKTMAHSQAALRAYLQQSQILSEGALDSKTREHIALATAGANGCNYCASAHAFIGKGLGIAADEAARSLRGEAADVRTQALLIFVRAILDTRGHVADAQLQSVRDAGFSDGEIVEIVASVAMNIFTNYFNHVAGTEVDFPLVKAVA